MFDNRFKQRGKRPTPDSSDSPKDTSTASDPPAKKPKTDAPLSESPAPRRTHARSSRAAQYQKEVKSYAGHGLKDDGIGVRPLV
ncbi:hypothetical protein DENSPDRAFT_841343, partial [Dentipellis sp. KUC8613]